MNCKGIKIKQTSSRPQQRLSSYGGKLSFEKKKKTEPALGLGLKDKTLQNLVSYDCHLQFIRVQCRCKRLLPKLSEEATQSQRYTSLQKNFFLVHNNEASQAMEGTGAKQKEPGLGLGLEYTELQNLVFDDCQLRSSRVRCRWKRFLTSFPRTCYNPD
jgi:hypothetical protein